MMIIDSFALPLADTTVSFWEWASYVVTVVGFPLAIYALWREARAERANEATEIQQRADEIYVRLSEQYADFLRAALDYPQLDLLNPHPPHKTLTPEQAQQKIILFEMLIALFERAYILLYSANMPAENQRRWQSWEDYLRWWCQKPDFSSHLIANLEGEDAGFVAHVKKLLPVN